MTKLNLKVGITTLFLSAALASVSLQAGAGSHEAVKTENVDCEYVLDESVLFGDIEGISDQDWDEEWGQVEDESDLYLIASEVIGIDIDTLFEQIEQGQSIAHVALSYGVDPQAIVDQAVAQEKVFVDELVADGDITQEEADEFLAEVLAEVTFEINQVEVDPLEIVAQVLNIDVDTLWQAMEDGKTIEGIAVENGVDVSQVVSAVITELTAEVNDLLAAELISEDEAAIEIKIIEAMVPVLVTLELPVLDAILWGDEVEEEWFGDAEEACFDDESEMPALENIS